MNCRTNGASILLQVPPDAGERGPPERRLQSPAMVPEPWLRGPLPGVDPFLIPAAHALVQASEDLERAAAGLTPDQLRTRPGGAASAAFHLVHIAGSIDRLLTYARGDGLNETERATAAAEPTVAESAQDAAALIAQAQAAIEGALAQIRGTPSGLLLEPRAVGRARLPSTVLGLLFHVAEHTQRHVGQLIATAKAVRAPMTRPCRVGLVAVAVVSATASLRAGASPLAGASKQATPAAVREWVRAHESAILHEFAELLAIPNLARDEPNIRRNAERDRGDARAARRRDAAARRRGRAAGRSTASCARRARRARVVFYAHYDGQPVDPAQWTTPPWTPGAARQRRWRAAGADRARRPAGRVDPRVAALRALGGRRQGADRRASPRRSTRSRRRGARAVGQPQVLLRGRGGSRARRICARCSRRTRSC